jgi:hypothetical protein
MSGFLSWEICNKIQWSYIGSFLGLCTVGRQVLLVHSKEAAQFLSCSQIFNCVPSVALHHRSISERGQTSGIAQMNRQAIIDSAHEDPVFVYNDYAELRLFVQSKVPMLATASANWFLTILDTHRRLHQLLSAG